MLRRVSPSSSLGRASTLYYIMVSLGVPETQAIAVVKARYGLDARAEKLVRRCVHPLELSVEVASRLVGPRELRGRRLCVDGYNQALTLYSLVFNGYAYLCTDAQVRDDLLGSPLKHSKQALKAVELLARVLAGLDTSETIVVLDSSVPMSGEAAATLRRMGFEAVAASKADKTLILGSRDCIIASSDIVVLRQAKTLHTSLALLLGGETRSYSLVDLAGHVARETARIASMLSTGLERTLETAMTRAGLRLKGNGRGEANQYSPNS